MTENKTNTPAPEAIVTQVAVANSYLTQDLKNSILIVSIGANLVILIAWMILQVTTQFDSEVANALFIR